MRQNLGNSFKQCEKKIWKRRQEIKTKQKFNINGNNHKWVFLSKRRYKHTLWTEIMNSPNGKWSLSQWSDDFRNSQNTTHSEKVFKQHKTYLA